MMLRNLVLGLCIILPISGWSNQADITQNSPEILSDNWVQCLTQYTEQQASSTKNSEDFIAKNAYKTCKKSGDALLALDIKENINLALEHPDVTEDPVELNALKKRIKLEQEKIWENSFNERMAPMLKCIVLYTRNGQNDYCDELISVGLPQ
ncbi:hypothetical protein [Providencia vermicola]|uniref:hypothetical protein n=1 Tax=Providencia vermicola TaxID=333965 RepID=UPI002204CED4|nr:hypothetical protein NFC79_06785 [Providencia stuartii]